MDKIPRIVSCKLPTGEGVYCGVTIEPYVLTQPGGEDIPEEGSPDGVYQLRQRWCRNTIPRGGAFCSVHPEKEATVQCVVCIKARVATHLSYHCSPECLKSHWHIHKDYHSQTNYANGDPPYENGGKGSLESWVEVSRSRCYTPTQDDIGYQLKFEMAIVERARPTFDMGRTVTVFTQRVRPTPTPPARQMVSLMPHASLAMPGSRFTLLSYNLLADLYAKADFTHTCPAWCLHWHYRKRNLLREMLNYKADILCLQEVQSDHFTDFWAPELQNAGYMAIYKKKTSEMFVDNKYAIDGCATFFRRDRFQLVKKYEVEFNKAAMSLAESFTAPVQKQKALNRLLKDNVALISVLEAVEPAGTPDQANKRTLICVANTHIHANKELSDVKLWQVLTLLKGLEKIAASADIPMLVAGDFNSEPGSAAHSLLVKKHVDETTLGAIDPLGFLKEQKLTHSLDLASAYAAMFTAKAADPKLLKQRQRMDAVYHEPLYTNLANNFKGTLDYILYTTKFLQPTAALELPLQSDILKTPNEHLPNAQYSSDHLALLSEFQYVQRM